MNGIKRFFGMLAVLCVAILAHDASAQLMRHDVPDQSHLDYANDPLFDSVVGIRYTNYSGQTRNGTGVYLGGGWVLTAGHVGRNNIHEPLYTDFRLVTHGNNVLTDPGYEIDSSSFVFHPDFEDEIIPGDLMLFHNPMYETLGLTPAVLSSSYMPTVGDRMTFATYGLPGVAGDRFYDPDGFLRAGENLVRNELTFGNFFDMRMDDPLPSGLPLEMGLTIGASGAPLFFNGEVVGLANYASVANPNYGATSGAEILSTHYDWINSVTVPGPGGLALLGVGSLLGLGRRRR